MLTISESVFRILLTAISIFDIEFFDIDVFDINMSDIDAFDILSLLNVLFIQGVVRILYDTLLHL